jgi:hypothetical protein
MLNDADILRSVDNVEHEELHVGNFRSECLHNFFVKSQKSVPLFSPSLMESLFVKGYAGLVAKLFVLMFESLKRHKDDNVLVSDYIDMDLSALLVEL